jgi:hypothetical protein
VFIKEGQFGEFGDFDEDSHRGLFHGLCLGLPQRVNDECPGFDYLLAGPMSALAE